MDKISRTNAGRLPSNKSNFSDTLESLSRTITTNEVATLSSSSSSSSALRLQLKQKPVPPILVGSSDLIPRYLIQPNLVYGQPAFLHSQQMHLNNLNQARNFIPASYRNTLFPNTASQIQTPYTANSPRVMIPTSSIPFSNNFTYNSNRSGNGTVYGRQTTLDVEMNDSKNIVPSEIENDEQIEVRRF